MTKEVSQSSGNAHQEKIRGIRKDKADRKASVERAREQIPGIRDGLRSLQQAHFAPLPDDLTSEQLSVLSSAERGRLFMDNFGREDERAILKVKGYLDGEKFPLEVTSEYPRFHDRPNQPTYTIDVPELKYLYVIGQTEVVVRSKKRISDGGPIIVGGRDYSYPKWQHEADETEMAEIQGILTMMTQEDTTFKAFSVDF